MPCHCPILRCVGTTFVKGTTTMSLKKIDIRIASIARNSTALNDQIHGTAVMIAEHAAAHGDCTRALALVKAMPASMRRTMLVLWFATFTPIRVVEKNDKVGMLKAEAKGFTPFDIEGGKAKPFHELAKDKPEADDLTADSVNKAITALIARLTKRVDEGKVAANDKDAVLKRIADLKVLAA